MSYPPSEKSIVLVDAPLPSTTARREWLAFAAMFDP
jgi:hypothetical protein